MKTMHEAPVIETERLRLRGHRAEDLAASAAMWGDVSVTRFIGGKPFTEEESWLRLLRNRGHWALLGFGYWVVEEKANGTFLGEAGLGEFRRDIQPSIFGTPEAGWVFAPGAHGRGYAFEAMQAVLAWGGERFGVGAGTKCLIAPENSASLKLAAKLGFVEDVRTTYHGNPTIVFAREWTLRSGVASRWD